MNYRYFINWMEDIPSLPERYTLRTVSLIDENLEVQGAQLMCTQYEEASAMQRVQYSPDYLFLGYTSELPDDPTFAPHNCVCVMDSPLPAPYQAESLGINLILVETIASDRVLMLLQNHIAFLLADDFRYYRKKEQVVSAELAQYDLNQGTQLVEKLIVNPIVVINPEGTVLATGDRYTFSDPLLAEDIVVGQLTALRLHELRLSNVYKALVRDYSENNRSKAYGFQNYLCVPVKARGMLVAEVIVQNWHTPFFHSTILLMESVAHLFGTIIDSRMEDHNDRALLHNLLFAELLRAAPERYEELKERIHEMSWKSMPGMRLLCCQAAEGDAEAAFTRLRLIYPSARWTLAWGKWLLLIYPEDGQPVDLKLLEERMQREGLRGGISWPFADLMQMPYAHEQANAAFSLGSTLLTDYAEAFATHVTSLPKTERIHYLHPSILQLAEVNRNYEGNLLQTVETYLAGPEQPAEVAAKLFISRSTLFYRLNRVRELCEIDWSTGQERMNLLLSIRLLRAMGMAD